MEIIRKEKKSTRMGFYAEDSLINGLQSLKDKYNVGLSELIRHACWEMITNEVSNEENK